MLIKHVEDEKAALDVHNAIVKRLGRRIG